MKILNTKIDCTGNQSDRSKLVYYLESRINYNNHRVSVLYKVNSKIILRDKKGAHLPNGFDVIQVYVCDMKIPQFISCSIDFR